MGRRVSLVVTPVEQVPPPTWAVPLAFGPARSDGTLVGVQGYCRRDDLV